MFKKDASAAAVYNANAVQSHVDTIEKKTAFADINRILYKFRDPTTLKTSL